MKVVVVESPAKAKTINKYLGPDFVVVASFGHVSDLPAKNGSVRPDEDFSMDWETDAKAEKHLREISQALKGADTLILATDPDREGEAISWHVRRLLEARKMLPGIAIQRVTFNEITKTAVQDGMRHPRNLDQELVDAYLARRALDYLVGFTLSPILWRKLPGSRSAGRVQSVALRLICEREAEIESFRTQEYWTVDADFLTQHQTMLTAGLSRLDGRKLDKFDLKDQAAAQAAEAKIKQDTFHVASVERKQAKRHPDPPFTTSTLQQEASRKLFLSARQTMQIAQRLYEGVDIGGETVGLITYMRTDGVQMADEAITAARSLIVQRYGDPYLPAKPRIYKTKTKNAQEAHEAIRPTDMFRHPRDVAPYLDANQLKLYELIWRRTVASQMESALLDQMIIEIDSHDSAIGFHATGSVVKFDGYLVLYHEGRDDSDDEDGNKRLPDVSPDEALNLAELHSLQHFTQPPPRFSEASLVKKLEELGIGRPSTYATIISVLQDRDYVRLENRRFVPEDRGRVVTAFLENFFARYVQYNFTADLENQLDEISEGKIDWKTVLRDFWKHFSTAIGDTTDLSVSQVLEMLDQELGPHFFPDDGSGRDPRLCPSCHTGRLNLKFSRYGAFIGCSNYPECHYTHTLTVMSGEASEASPASLDEPKILGNDPQTGATISLRKGPYGVYVQLGEEEESADKKKNKKNKPKRISLPKGMDPASVSLDIAIGLLSLPREIGIHPETKSPILAGIGRFGPYLKHGDIFKSLGRDDNVLTIDLDRSVELLATAKPRKAAKDLGNHPKDGKPVLLKSGRFGSYISHGTHTANLPRGTEDISLDEAVALLTAKAESTKKRRTASGDTAEQPPAKSTKTVSVKKRRAPQKTTTMTPLDEPKKKRVKKPPTSKD